MSVPPRWGFSSLGVDGYKDVAPPELEIGRSAAARTAALIQGQWKVSRPSRRPIDNKAQGF
jgi:hypothetical protein